MFVGCGDLLVFKLLMCFSSQCKWEMTSLEFRKVFSCSILSSFTVVMIREENGGLTRQKQMSGPSFD